MKDSAATRAEVMETPQTSVEGPEPAAEAQVRPSPRRVPMALVTLTFVFLVLLIVVVLVVVKVTRGSTTVNPPPVAPASSAVVHAATSVPAEVFDQVGAPEPESPGPMVLQGRQALVIDGRPGIVYVGAEFCPYCAAERWALVVALGRFGTFSGLGATSSSKFEVFPSTATFSFEGASYRSHYVTFSAVEEYGPSPSSDAPAGFPKLQPLRPLDQTLLRRYDDGYPPGSGDDDSLPFVDVVGRLVSVGSGIGFSPGLLQGDSMGQIAAALSVPTNPLSMAIVGEANDITAAICSATGQQPSRVCNSSGVQAAAERLRLGT